MIGTGSTGIQAIPIIAEQAAHLFVFQRTAQYSVPARNEPLNVEEETRIKADYKGYRERNTRQPFGLDLLSQMSTINTSEVGEEERRQHYQGCWEHGGQALMLAYADTGTDKAANETVSDFLKEKIHSVVKDSKVAEVLTPDHIYACKRPCLDTNYFEVYNRPNVTLVDCRSTGIEHITPTGVMVDGRAHPLDGS